MPEPRAVPRPARGARNHRDFALTVAGLAFRGDQHRRHLPGAARQDVNVVGLENAPEVGLVRRPRMQAFDGRFLVAEGCKKGVGELCGIERLFREIRDALFDFYGVLGRADTPPGVATMSGSLCESLMLLSCVFSAICAVIPRSSLN
jgi:hypothetical protein